MGLDIGQKTVDNFSMIIKGAKTIIWNGPMGVFEKPPFDRGTVALLLNNTALTCSASGRSKKPDGICLEPSWWPRLSWAWP